ncbi:MAG TPA: PHP domain-containing protein [Terriglobia bacterium]|nr:PHP domain-containing protein [Terriglobia bacterium]
MLKSLVADLHLHTVLSACAEVEMTPLLIVRRASQLGLGIIGITDHNACLNAGAVMQAVQGTGISVLPGMELQTREEVHMLCLFDSLERCWQWQDEVWAKLPGLENREEVFGPQFVVDASGDWVRTEPRLLSTSADISIEAATARVHELGGAAIPCHVDRPSFSLLANLGFIPPGLEADALEVTVQFRPEKNPTLWGKLEGRPLVVSGDAHRLQDVQARTTLTVEEAVIPEILQAFRGENGRSLKVNWS